MYQLTDSPNTIVRTADGAFLPTDWQAYKQWLEDGNTPDPAPVPPFAWPSLSPRQIRLQLLADGNLDKVQPAIDSLPSPQQTAAQISWDHASMFLHDDPLISSLAPAVGYDTPEKVRAFFVAAALL